MSNLSTSWTRFTLLLIVWTILIFATIITLFLMISEIEESQHLLEITNISTPHLEKIVVQLEYSTGHILMALLYAILLAILAALDIEVAKEMFKE